MSDFLGRAQQALVAGNVTVSYQLLIAAVREDAGNADVWFQYGLVLGENLRRYPGAVSALRRAVELRPEDGRMWTALGWYLHLTKRSAEGEVALREALRVMPHLVLAHVNLSHVLTTLGRVDEGLRHARIAVDLARPVSGGMAGSLDDETRTALIAHLALAFAMFFNGRWVEGFKWFEARLPLRLPDMAAYPMPRWDGRKVGTLFLVREQGLGDTIQMLRYVGAAAARADRVIFQVQRELTSLCREMFPGVEVEAMPCALPSGVDAFCPLMGLPALLWDDAKQGAYIGDWDRAGPVRRVGLVWAGDPTHENDQHRSIGLAELMPLTEIADIEFVSLQVGPRGTAEMDAVGAHGLVRDASPGLFDMRDTARVIEGLDLVIGVDTAVMHLVGAMGCPGWLLVNTMGADWRWGRGETNNWYPSLRTFRRSLTEQWSDVVNRVKQELIDAKADIDIDGCVDGMRGRAVLGDAGCGADNDGAGGVQRVQAGD